MLKRSEQFVWNHRNVSFLLPKSYFTSPFPKFPVMITQDGDYIFNQYRIKQQPDVIFVGLTPFNRNTEYVPWDANTDVGNYKGHADTYLQMLIKDFIPFLRGKYRIDTKNLGLAGGSFGGLVTLYALINYNAYFKTYIMLSPSLWYPKFLDHINKCGDITAEKNVFWYVGGAEALRRPNIMGEMVSNNHKAVQLVNKKLKHPKSKLIFMTNHNGLHRHCFFIRHFKQAVTLFYDK